MLGTDLVPALAAAGHDPVGVDLEEGDLTQEGVGADLIRKHAPGLVIHCAAMTDVDGCERDPERAWQHNVLATWRLAAACREQGAPLAYISTDFVFDGAKGAPYHEWDAPNPLGAYGYTKWAGEEAIRRILPQHYVIRTAWLFGRTGRNFVRTMVTKAREGNPLRVVADQVGSPTYTGHLAAAIARHIVGNPLHGTYHVTNAGMTNWADLAREALRAAGLACEVVDISSADWPSPTRRPAFSALEHRALALQGRDDLPPWQEGVAEAVAGI